MEGGRECKKIQGAADHHGAEAKSCERHCVNMCGTTQHAEKPSGVLRSQASVVAITGCF